MVSTIENESVTSGLKITFRYRIVHLLVASCTVSEGMRCELWKYYYYIYLFCWSQVTCKKLTGWDATSWNCVVCSYRSVKANLLRVHVIWRHYSKWSPKHSSMKSVSNLSEGNLYYWKRKLLNTIFPKRKALGMNRNQICISWKQPAQECSQAPCFVCVLSCTHPASETKPRDSPVCISPLLIPTVVCARRSVVGEENKISERPTKAAWVHWEQLHSVWV